MTNDNFLLKRVIRHKSGHLPLQNECYPYFTDEKSTQRFNNFPRFTKLRLAYLRKSIGPMDMSLSKLICNFWPSGRV